MATPTTDPADEFIAEVADIRLKAAGRDTALLRLSTVLMPLGIILGVVALLLARNTDNPLDQRDAIIIAITGLSVSVVGVGLFLRYSLAEFLRFWMARLILQQQGGTARTEAGDAAT